MRLRHILYIISAVITSVVMWGCSATKHVPDGMRLLDKVTINIDNDTISETELYNFLRQQPNHKVLGFLKLQLATYNLSGSDTSKWYNRWIQSLGQPPVLYDSVLTLKSAMQLRQALINRGYMDATVEIDSIVNDEKKRVCLVYNISAGEPHVISDITYNIPDTAIARILYADSTLLSIHPGELLDRNRLEMLRTRISERLRNNGYYDFSKEYITFIADTVSGVKDLSLTLNIKESRVSPTIPVTAAPTVNTDSLRYSTYTINNVYFVTNYNPQSPNDNYSLHADTVNYRGITVYYGKDRYLRPSVLYDKCFIQRGELYNSQAVERTYEALGQLGILKFINITMRPVQSADGRRLLNVYIMISRTKRQSISLEVEGTNSEGDLGFGAGVTYQHHNLAKGSELLTAKFRASYESLSGNFDGLVNNRYTEYAGEVGITFPKFMFPLLKSDYKRRRRPSTEFALSMNYQERPEYTRVIAGAAWRYKWGRQRGTGYRNHQQLDLIDVNYVKLPKSTLNFLDSIAPANPLLRYSYEDHFIMRLGYTVSSTNKRIPSAGATNAFALQPSFSSFRLSTEIAGNVLYAISSLTHQHKDDGAYKIFGIQYSQYFKAETDFMHTINLNDRSAVAMHAGMGIAIPYLNSKMVPFEKRFYAGGANGVRGWGVRTLGPGAYDSRNSVTDFINQCGDILLNLNIEYRAKLFWVFEGAAFVDTGNIWTIREYVNQPGGVFRFDRFYKQLAAAYGVGLRMDFSYFLLRFDLGIKAHNPAKNQEHWPLLHPSWHRDATFHFAVGYPF